MAGPLAFWRRWRSTRAKRSALGHEAVAGAVHGDVAVALEQAHQAADLVEHRALLGRRDQRHQPAVGQRVLAAADGLGDAAQRLGEALGVGVDRVERLLDQTEEVRAHPRRRR